MSATLDSNSLQWMADVGVPLIEVRWLERMKGSPKLNHPVAVRRVENMQKMALAGLVATSKPVVAPLALPG